MALFEWIAAMEMASRDSAGEDSKTIIINCIYVTLFRIRITKFCTIKQKTRIKNRIEAFDSTTKKKKSNH